MRGLALVPELSELGSPHLRAGTSHLGLTVTLLQELGSEQVVINVYSMNGHTNVQMFLDLEQTFCSWKEAGVRGNDDANWNSDGAKPLALGKAAAKSSSSQLK